MGTGSNSATSTSQLDVVFDGTWVIAPSVDANGKVIGIDIYSPACDHPHGVTFVGGLNPSPWPQQSAFYQLDNHGHAVNIQRSNGSKAGMALSGIDTKANHCLTKARPIGADWDLFVSIPLGPDKWTSSDTVAPQITVSGAAVPCFVGQDAPTDNVSSMQTLTFLGVTSLQLFGAPGNVQALLPSPWSNGQGTLIFENEIPYVPTLQHERAAISAMASLAGLDLALNYPLPKKLPAAPAAGGVARPMLHTSGGFCGHSLIVMPS
jgi:hypothetical protein